MFVAVTRFANNRELRRWADKKDVPELFATATTGGGFWNYRIVVDDHVKPEGGTVSINSEESCIFYAKDKSTLRDGLSFSAPDAKVAVTGAQIGIYCASYDFERAAGWGMNKIDMMQNWSGMSAADMRRFKAEGLDRGDYSTFMSRQRLLKRGHFMIVGANQKMQNMRGAVFSHHSEMLLRSLGHWVD